MSEDDPRRGAARDVPPPRPVAGGGGVPEQDGGPLARAARAVADAVSGLVGGDRAADDETGATAAGLRDMVAALAGAVGARARGARADVEWSPGAFLGDLLSAAAPRLPIRDRARLREAQPGASDEEIAEALVARAARLTAGIGAATGGVSAAQWFAMPSLVALPLELAVETVLVAAVEVVLVGELHELYGRPAPGSPRERAAAYLSSWSAQRPLDPVAAPGLVSVLGSAGLQALRRRLARRVARNVPSLTPFFIGAVLGGRGNRKATESLARRLVADLRAGRRS